MADEGVDEGVDEVRMIIKVQRTANVAGAKRDHALGAGVALSIMARRYIKLHRNAPSPNG